MAQANMAQGSAVLNPTTGEHCLVAQMAAEYVRLTADPACMDAAQFSDPADRDVRDTSLARLDRRIEAIAAGLTAVQATSVEGGLAQLALVASFAESYRTSVVSAEYAAERDAAIPRLLYSAITAIAAHHGIDLTGPLFERHMPEWLDPFGEVRHAA